MASHGVPVVLIFLLLLFFADVNGFVTRGKGFHGHRQNLLSLQGEASTRTKEMFESISDKREGSGAGGSASFEGLQRLDESWEKLKAGGWKNPPPKLVYQHRGMKSPTALEDVEGKFDIVVSGGTLGIFFALALTNLGHKVCVVERGKVAGRPQEWNIANNELQALKRLGILKEEEIKEIIGIEFNPVRVGFKTDTSPMSEEGGFEAYVRDILNLGIKPDVLIEMVKEKFLNQGGTLLEESPLKRIDVYSDMAVIDVGKDKRITTRLVIDAMGNGSPISRQIRGPVEPDGICVVVGGCASGFNPSNNTYSDVIYTDTPITEKASSQLQYFWEAFPAGSGPSDRTTYLFTYMDAKPERPSIMEIMNDYWELLPRYQGVDVDELQYKRILYGCFPTYRDSPLKAGFDRILQVGDASGIQSPLSFGGFGSLTRHIGRIVGAVDEALAPTEDPMKDLYPRREYIPEDLVSAKELGMINCYQPNLSTCWMFQRAMSVRIGNQPNNKVIVGTLSNSFSAMEKLGDRIMRPFLQDVLQFGPLLQTLTLAAGQDLLTPFKVVPQVGFTAMADFFYHFSALAIYTLLASTVADPVKNLASFLPRKFQFQTKRLAEGWKFGSGLDYYDHE